MKSCALSLILLAAQVDSPVREAPPPEVLAQVQQLSEALYVLIGDLDRSRDPKTWVRNLPYVMRGFPFADLVLIEGRLRRRDSKTYLMAKPVRLAPAGTRARAPLGVPAGDLEYVLHVEVGGRDAMLKRLGEFGTADEAENLKLLRRTGLPVEAGPGR